MVKRYMMGSSVVSLFSARQTESNDTPYVGVESVRTVLQSQRSKGYVVGSNMVSMLSARQAESNDIQVEGVWSLEVVSSRIGISP